MGVPKFFRYISERYPCLSELVRMHQVPDFDNLYLDMNGIVHNCTHPDDSKVNQKITEEMMFLAIFRYIEYLFQVIKPRKLFFMAIDGVAPRAKMNQQRGRRFRSAKEMETRENEAKKKGEVIEEEYRFDSNCITPGTEFMVRLHRALQFFIQRQISTNESWQGCQVILSGHDTPGEGEHKIMDYIRYMKSQPGYDPNTTHCLYGLDADLIMLGCVTHESHISLLREEVKFGKQNTKSNCVENTRFFLLHLGILREYLELEFSAVREKVPFGYDMDKIVDDWILMSFLVGNDFVPHLPNLHINSNALPTIYNAYMDVLPSLGGYMNENGILNLPRFQTFLQRLQVEDRRLFKEQHGETRYMSGDMDCFDEDVAAGDPNDELAALVRASEQMMMDDVRDGEETEETLFEKEFQMGRRDYYITKMHFPQEAAEHQQCLRAEVRHYISALQWILHYYYRGVPSWSWYYPNHYAPYISDLTNILEMDSDFQLGSPFLPFEQLLGVLPPNSKDLLPVAYQYLMLNPNSELIEFYPPNFETDMNGKKQEWEALVLIPFIDEKRLLSGMAKCEPMLLEAERSRNRHGPMSVYKYCEENTGPVEGVMKLPDLPNSYCTCESVSYSAIDVPKNRLVFGPPKGVLKDVHFPGFPTMKFLEYSGKFANLRVRVFEMPSNNETMEVTVHQPIEEQTKSVADLYNDLFDKEIFVGWPHLSHAKVVGVSDDKCYMGMQAAVLNEHEVKKFDSYVKDIKDHHLKRMGIRLGNVKLLVHVQLVKAKAYALGHSGRLVLNTEWDNVKFVYPYQTIVRNVNIYNEQSSMYKTVDEVYKRDTKVFLLSTKYYGCMGKVLDTSMLASTKRIQITIDVHAEPNLKEAMRLHSESKLAARASYFNMYNACSQVGISKHALNRITGNFYVFSGKRRQINERSADKVNIGLQMRLPKDQKEVPGISKFMDHAWYLSADAIDIICQYLDQFPRMCEALAKPDNNIFEDDFCSDPELIPGTHLRELAIFAETLPHAKIRPRKMGAEYVDPMVAEAVERAAGKIRDEVQFKTIKLQTKLHLLFLPQTTIKCPDPGTTFRLFDRVIVATHNLSIPIGTKGTIVSIFYESDENPLKYENKNVTTYMYEVMFDEEVPNGDAYFGQIGYSKVQVVTEQAIINITYGRNLDSHRTDQTAMDPVAVDNNAAVNSKRDQQGNTRNNARQQQQQPQQQQRQHIPPNNPPAATEAEDEKRTKDMLNNIWNQLKVNAHASNPGIAFPPTASSIAAPQGLDLTETLKKCLKIAPSEGNRKEQSPQSGYAAAKMEVPVPAPAQLPPPPANWRIEAQIQHLNQVKSPAPAQPQPHLNVHPRPFMVSSGGPPPRMQQQIRHPPPMFQQQMGFNMGMMPRPQLGFPQQQGGRGGFPPHGQVVMPAFRPVAAVPFTHSAGPMPFMNAGGDGQFNRQFHPNQYHNRNNNNQSTYRQEDSRLSGPHTLRNTASTSGHGAFIPLQAARKITKLKSMNGAGQQQERVAAEEGQAGGAGAAAKKSTVAAEQPRTDTSNKSKEQPPKKAPAVAKSKANAAPRPPRIAANFSVKE